MTEKDLEALKQRLAEKRGKARQKSFIERLPPDFLTGELPTWNGSSDLVVEAHYKAGFSDALELGRMMGMVQAFHAAALWASEDTTGLVSYGDLMDQAKVESEALANKIKELEKNNVSLNKNE